MSLTCLLQQCNTGATFSIFKILYFLVYAANNGGSKGDSSATFIGYAPCNRLEVANKKLILLKNSRGRNER